MTEQAASSGIYPVLPLRNSLLFPQLLMPLIVGREKSVAAVEAAVASEDKTIVVVAQEDADADEPTLEQLFHVGTLAVIKRLDRGDDSVQVIVHGLEKVALIQGEPVEGDTYLSVKVERLPKPEDTDAEIEALQREVLELAGKIVELALPQAQESFSQAVQQVTEPLHQAFLLATMVSLDLEKEKRLLLAESRREAMKLMHEFLTHELQVAELRHKIASQTQSEMSRQQREYVLRQQLQAIQEELGEQSPEEAEAAELRRQMDEANLPEKVRTEAERELSRLERMSPNAADFQVTRTYLEYVLELPWNKLSEDILDLGRAQTILDEDHYDLKEVKDRILDHLAVMRLNPQAQAPILCFVGPPGVGKTSLGKSIARSLGRTFERISLGGMHDEAELRGHRRTYIGAMPGRIIQAIRRAGVRNPLLMLDEMDKLGHDYRGDPSAALMEILDPAQNSEFRDNFLDLPFDLSRVFFIATANTLDSIPRPLLDRMEVLRLAGYSDEEKKHIARQYLIPRQLEDAGLKPEDLTILEETLMRIIRRYTREAGVRNLERTLGSLCRKVARRFAEGQEDAVTASPDDLSTLLGPEKFFQEDARKELAPGVAAGLAWTESGGEVLYVEAVRLEGRSEFVLTGQLGDVMKESAKAAQSYVLSRAEELELDEETVKLGVHIHVPAGATPKDGPSAGVTIVAALASLYTGHPARRDTAMTGEMTLSGLVLPVGGIKEKVLAAHRAGLKRIILPVQNEKDLSDLPDQVRSDLEFIFAAHLDDVVTAAIPELSLPYAATESSP